MAVRSRQVGPFVLTVAAANLYSVPVGRTLIIKTITLYNGTGASANVGLAIQSGGFDYYFLRRTGFANTTSETIAGLELVLNPSMILRGFASVNPGFWLTVSGSLLDGSPS